MRTSLLFTGILCAILFCNCQKSGKYYTSTGSNHTYYRIKYEYSRSLDQELQNEFKKYYHSLNPFDSLSIVSFVNRNKTIEADSIFIHAFRTAMQVSAQTGGIFDITAAPLINLWGFGFSKTDSISPAMIDSLKSFVGFRKVRLEGNQVIKDDPRILLNFSALGDGCICDQIARFLDKKGIENYLVDIGGEVMAKGLNPQGGNWSIGIVRPLDDSTGTNTEVEEIIRLSGRMGLATSGDYRNFYIKDGKKYAHTLNPVTGYPAGQNILSATVIAQDCIIADAYATVFMALGTAGTRELKKEHPELEYFIIYTDEEGHYSTEYSDGMKKYLTSGN